MKWMNGTNGNFNLTIVLLENKECIARIVGLFANEIWTIVLMQIKKKKKEFDVYLSSHKSEANHAY